jgi:hypothetical protein
MRRTRNAGANPYPRFEPIKPAALKYRPLVAIKSGKFNIYNVKAAIACFIATIDGNLIAAPAGKMVRVSVPATWRRPKPKPGFWLMRFLSDQA